MAEPAPAPAQGEVATSTATAQTVMVRPSDQLTEGQTVYILYRFYSVFDNIVSRIEFDDL